MGIVRRCALPVLWLALAIQAGWVLVNEFFLHRSPGLGWLGAVVLVSFAGFAAFRRGPVARWMAVLVRVVVAAQLLNAVADRFGLWGLPGADGVAWGSYDNFIGFTRQLSSFLPAETAPVLAHLATVGELVLGIGLLVGIGLRWVAGGAAVLLVSFGVAMTITVPLEQQFSYSVFLLAAGMFVLAVRPEAGVRAAAPVRS